MDGWWVKDKLWMLNGLWVDGLLRWMVGEKRLWILDGMAGNGW